MIQGQPKRWSLFEAISNTFIGFWISFFAMMGMYWWLDIPVTHGQNLFIGAFLTGVSVLRGYILRRLFDAIYLRLLHGRST